MKMLLYCSKIRKVTFLRKNILLMMLVFIPFTLVACGSNSDTSETQEVLGQEDTQSDEDNYLQNNCSGIPNGYELDVSDEEIHILYQRAFEALSWFHLTTMPGEWLGMDESIEMYGNRYDVRVIHDRISSLADLRAYLLEIFTEDFVDNLFVDYIDGGVIRRFVDIDGVLHTIGADRGGNILAGEIRTQVIRPNPNEIVYRVSVDIHDFETPWEERSPDNAVDVEESNFVLVNVNGVWLFTDFWLVI